PEGRAVAHRQRLQDARVRAAAIGLRAGRRGRGGARGSSVPHGRGPKTWHVPAMRSLRAVVLAPALVLFACALPGCGGDDDPLVPFDVALTTTSDCEQVGQGGVNCVDPGALAAVTL